MNTASCYGTGGWGLTGEHMKPLFWNKKKGKLQDKPPLTVPEKLLCIIALPFIIFCLSILIMKYAEGAKQGKSFVQIVNS